MYITGVRNCFVFKIQGIEVKRKNSENFENLENLNIYFVHICTCGIILKKGEIFENKCYSRHFLRY